MIGDVCVTVALAGTLFFNISPGAARPKVLLYLLLTVAPFALVAPVIGPLLDRSRSGRRTLMSLGCFGRAGLCLLMAGNVNGLLLFPLAFGVLVLAKGHQVAKSALVPALVNDETALVTANSRLALISIAAGAVGGIPAAVLLELTGAGWVLAVAAIAFLVAGLLALRIPRGARGTTPETPEERAELHVPSIVLAGTAMALLRTGVGFLTFLVAFGLKEGRQPTWFFGAVLAVSAVGGFVGNVLAPFLRRRVKEEWILVGSLLTPALVAFVGRPCGGPVGVHLHRGVRRNRRGGRQVTGQCRGKAQARPGGCFSGKLAQRFESIKSVLGLGHRQHGTQGFERLGIILVLRHSGQVAEALRGFGSDAARHEFIPNASRPNLFQLVNGHQGGALQRLIYTCDFNHAAQYYPMVEGDAHIAKAQVRQHLTDGVDHLRFSQQGGSASDVHITLIKLSKTSFSGAVSPPHWLDLVALEEAG